MTYQTDPEANHFEESQEFENISQSSFKPKIFAGVFLLLGFIGAFLLYDKQVLNSKTISALNFDYILASDPITSISSTTTVSTSSSSSSSVELVLSMTDSDYGVPASAEYLPWDFLVSPYKTLTASVDSATISGQSLSLSSYSYQWQIAETIYSGNPASFEVTNTGAYNCTVTITDSVGTSFTQKFTMAVKYIRREIRTMTSSDLETYFNALETIYNTNQADGESLYGSKYLSAESLLYKHLTGAGTTDCDHWHDGAGLIPHHAAFTLAAEQSLQAINPAISMPYWEYTIDSEIYDDYNWVTSPFFSDDWFSEASPSTDEHYISKGRWAGYSLPDGSPYLDWSISEKGTLNPYVNGRGYMRSPWNNNPSPYIGRSNSTFGSYSSLSGLGRCSCSAMSSCFNSESLATMNDCLNGYTHGVIHIMIGGAWGDEYMFEDVDDDAGSTVVTLDMDGPPDGSDTSLPPLDAPMASLKQASKPGAADSSNGMGRKLFSEIPSQNIKRRHSRRRAQTISTTTSTIPLTTTTGSTTDSTIIVNPLLPTSSTVSMPTSILTTPTTSVISSPTSTIISTPTTSMISTPTTSLVSSPTTPTIVTYPTSLIVSTPSYLSSPSSIVSIPTSTTSETVSSPSQEPSASPTSSSEDDIDWNYYSDVIGFLKGNKKILMFKMLWRMGWTRCPSGCSDDDECRCSVPDEYIDTYGAYYILESSGVISAGGRFISTDYTDDQYLAIVRALEHPGAAGEMFSSGAPFDPTFWPLHGTIERLLGLRRIQLANGAITTDDFDETWGYETSNYLFLVGICDWSAVTSPTDLTIPTCNMSLDAVCPGHHSYDTLEFENFLGTDDTYTNAEFYEFVHPWNADLPYTFDSFDFDLCYDYDSSVDFYSLSR